MGNELKIHRNMKIHFDGRDYRSPSDLSPEVRAAYDKAAARETVSLNHVLDKIIVNGPHFVIGGRQAKCLYQDILSVVESNGEVTLPVDRPFFTKARIATAAGVLGALAAAAAAVAVAVKVG